MFGKLKTYRRKTKTETKINFSVVIVRLHSFYFALFLFSFKMIFKVNNFLSFNLSETMIKKMENE